MFRKGKKNVGQVTVMDDTNQANRDALLGTSKSQDGDDFSDLGVSPVNRDGRRGGGGGGGGGGGRSVGQMSVQELEDMAIKEAMQGREGTQRALDKAREARTIGVDTAEKLHGQTKQLEKMSEDIEVVHDYLDKGERLIEKMSRPKLVRMFVRGKGKGKGLDKVKSSKKQLAKRDNLRNRGVSGMDLNGMKGGEAEDGKVQMEDLERAELLGGEKSNGGGRRGFMGRMGKKEVPRTQATDIKEDYSQYSSGVAGAMRQQDEDLDEISTALGDMKGLAEAMNKELEYQEGMIEQVGDFTTHTAARTKDNVRRVNKLLK